MHFVHRNNKKVNHMFHQQEQQRHQDDINEVISAEDWESRSASLV